MQKKCKKFASTTPDSLSPRSGACHFAAIFPLLAFATLACGAGADVAALENNGLRLDQALRISPTAWPAAESTQAAYSLTELVLSAWSGSPEIAGANAQEQAAQARIDRARGRRLPSLSLAASNITSRYSGESGTQRNLIGSATLSLPLYRPRLSSDIAVAESENSEAALARRDLAGNLALRIVTAYVGIINLYEDIQALESERRLVAEQHRSNRLRLEGGVATIIEVGESALRERIIGSQLAGLQRDIEAQLTELRRLSLNPQADTGRFREMGQMPDFIPDGPEQARSRMENENPALIRARQTVKTAQANQAAQSTGHLPTLDFIAQTGRQRSTLSGEALSSNQNTQEAGLLLAIPLYAGGTVSASTREAAALADKAGHDLAQTRDRLHAELSRAFVEKAKFDEQIESSQESLALANAVAEQTAKSFRAGIRSNIDLINAQRQISEVRRDLNKARAGQLLAQARILNLTGELDEARLQAMDRLFAAPARP